VRLQHDVEEGHLADGCCYALVLSGGGERVAAAHGRSECRHTIAVDVRQRAAEGDRRAPVLELARRLKQIGLAVAVAEAAMVERERRDTLRGKALGESSEAIASRTRHAMRHHDQGSRCVGRIARGGLSACVRKRGGRIQPRGALLGAYGEAEVFACGRHALHNATRRRNVR
jgi:hypothetical protein